MESGVHGMAGLSALGLVEVVSSSQRENVTTHSKYVTCTMCNIPACFL